MLIVNIIGEKNAMVSDSVEKDRLCESDMSPIESPKRAKKAPRKASKRPSVTTEVQPKKRFCNKKSAQVNDRVTEQLLADLDDLQNSLSHLYAVSLPTNTSRTLSHLYTLSLPVSHSQSANQVRQNSLSPVRSKSFSRNHSYNLQVRARGERFA